MATLRRTRLLLGTLRQFGITLKLLISANTSWYLLNFRAGLINRLLEEGHDIWVMAPPDPSMPSLSVMGCRPIVVAMSGKSRNVFREIRLLLKYFYTVLIIKPDAYISFTIKPVLYGGLATRVLNIPTVVTITGLGTVFIRETFMTKVVETLYRFALRSTDKVFFQNEADRSEFIKRKLVQIEQTERIPGSGIDVKRFSYQSPRLRPADGGMMFLMVARVLKDKGIFEFVKAASRIKEIYPTTRFVLAGQADFDNPTAISIEQVKSWQDEGAIDYMGFVKDINRLVGDADCVILPSYREGLSRSLLEACAVGRPIITTSVPGCADVIEDGVSGLMCEPRDADDLARKIEEFINLPSNIRKEMGLQGRQKIEREFDEEIVISSYVQTINSLLMGKA